MQQPWRLAPTPKDRIIFGNCVQLAMRRNRGMFARFLTYLLCCSGLPVLAAMATIAPSATTEAACDEGRCCFHSHGVMMSQ